MCFWIEPRRDGLVDVVLGHGRAVPFCKLDGRVDFRIRSMIVRGVDPLDPRWGGDLDGHIRLHFPEWMAAAEEIET